MPAARAASASSVSVGRAASAAKVALEMISAAASCASGPFWAAVVSTRMLPIVLAMRSASVKRKGGHTLAEPLLHPGRHLHDLLALPPNLDMYALSFDCGSLGIESLELRTGTT